MEKHKDIAKKRGSVLIVDDENLNILAFKQILGSEYTIYAVKSGQQALETAEKLLPDVILLDILMPDIDGYEVITQLKNSPKTKDIPVIFITGLSSAEDEEKGLTLGAADYIIKPFNPAIVKLRLQNQIKILEQLRTIEQLSEEAQAASRSKSTFLAMMSHEIRTPMNAILGITEILSEIETLPEEAAEGLGKIHSSGNLLLTIINDILDFSKIDAGKLDIIPAQYNIAGLISDSIYLNMMRIGDKPVEFELQIDENVPSTLVGDELRIKQILNNLLSNAFKYTDAGKVTLTVKSELKNESAFGTVGTVTLIFSVQDTGHGMSSEQLEKLFEEYSRLDKETSHRNIEGTGLGLVITQRLIKLMDGDIQVESEAGKGSLFVIRLPQEIVNGEVLGKEQAKNLKQINHKISDGLTGALTFKKRSPVNREPMPYGRVLVVDDIETNIDVATGLLKPYGLQLDTIMSGRDAIEIIKSGKKYDIVLMDHLMPDIDGIEAARQIREFGYTDPIVALTANAIAGQAEIFLKSGFDDYISKPIDIRQLDAVLNKYIRDKQPPKILKSLQESFVRDAKKCASAFDELLQNGKIETEEGLNKFKIMVHGIKSSLGNIRQASLMDTAYKLEKGSHNGDIEFVKSAAPEFVKNLKKLLETLDKEEASCKTGLNNEDAKSRAKFSKTLQKIRASLANYDRKEALVLLEGIKCRTKKTKAALDSIKENVIHAEFEKAEKKAAALQDAYE